MSILLREVPERIETERLVILAPRIGDGAVVAEAARESADELRPWMTWVDPLPTPEVAEEGIRRAIAAFVERRDLRYLAFTKNDGRYVGGTGLHEIDWRVPRFEIGYWIRSSSAGRGYATEIVRALSEACFAALAAERVEIRCDARNERSARVARAAGYPLEARLHHHRRGLDGALSDTLIFARTRG